MPVLILEDKISDEKEESNLFKMLENNPAYETFLIGVIGIEVLRTADSNLPSSIKGERITELFETAPLRYFCSLVNYAQNSQIQLYH